MSMNRYDLSQQGSRVPSSVKLLYISTAKYGGDWHSTPHSHPCAELFYVVGGKGRFRIDDDLFDVSVDDLVVVNPLVQHTEVSVNANPLEYIVLGVEGLELSVKNEQDDRFCIVNFRGIGEDILFCLRGMLKEIERKQPEFESVCQDLLEILMVRLMRRTNYTAALVPPQAASKECATVRRYIDAHFKENLTLDQLAQVARVNKYHMAHAFTREYGISPISYLNSRRIAESRNLLETTDMSLSSISQALGFSSPSYFSQSFRRHEGISPLAFRQNRRKP